MQTSFQELLAQVDSLGSGYRELREGVRTAIRVAEQGQAPRLALTQLRSVLELVVRDLYEHRLNESPGTRPLANLLDGLVKKAVFPVRLEAYATAVLKLGNVGTHYLREEVTDKDVYHSLSQLVPVLEWFFREGMHAPAKEAADPSEPEPSASSAPAGKSPGARPGKAAEVARSSWRRIMLISMAATMFLLLLAPLVWRFLPGGQRDSDSRASSAQTSPPSVSDGGAANSVLRVKSLRVHHFARVGEVAIDKGVIGEKSFAPPQFDWVQVDAKLSRPAYAYLIAFRADGTQELCFPEDETEVPALTDNPRYPSKSRDDYYGLAEGTGLWVFAVVASEKPLPSYHDWWTRVQGQTPWKSEPEADDDNTVWWDDGQKWVERLTPFNSPSRGDRGKGEKLAGEKSVVRLADWLKQATQADAIGALGFAVRAP